MAEADALLGSTSFFQTQVAKLPLLCVEASLPFFAASFVLSCCVIFVPPPPPPSSTCLPFITPPTR